MKRKGLVSLVLVGVMTVMSVVPALAGEISVSGDVNTSDHNTTADDWYTCTGETNFNVNNDAVVGGINGNGNDVNISGSGSLTVNNSHDPNDYNDQTPFNGISGQNVNISDTHVEVNGDSGGISAANEVNITNSDVSVSVTGIGTAISASGGVTIDNSKVNSTAGDAHAIATWGGNINIQNGSEVTAGSNISAIFAEGNGTINIGNGLSIKTPAGGTVGTAEGAMSVLDASGNMASTVVIGKGSAAPEKPEQPAVDDSAQSQIPEYLNVKDKKEESSSNNNSNAQSVGAAPVIIVMADPATMGEAAYTTKITESIANAPFGGTVKIFVTDSAYLNELIISALETRSDVSLELSVTVGGVSYVLNIPAGYDLRALLGTNGKIDMQKLIALFGKAL